MTDAPVSIPKKLFNFTPHTINVFKRVEGQADPELIVSLPSDGELRLLSKKTPSTDFQLLHENGETSSLPCVPYAGFDGLDKDLSSACIELIHANRGKQIGILVSMAVGQFFAKHPHLLFGDCEVLGPDTGPANVVRKNGDIIGTYSLLKYAQCRDVMVSSADGSCIFVK